MGKQKQYILTGDCERVLAKIPDNSIDAIVTDPPYGISFMSKRWDYAVPSISVWAQCLRVLKPGGHLLSFAGTRTQHRMAVNIEDAGFDIRDMIAWVYGSGFPKSLNVSKAFDKDAAKQWEGWGTALKPAMEPITVARKPLEGTVALNVLRYGTGALNVGECRVGTEEVKINTWDDGAKPFGGGAGHTYTGRTVIGRWPANFIHDGSDTVQEILPDNSARYFYCSKANAEERGPGNNHPTVKPLALMEYLIRLVLPPGGIVLDPFAGSGSTLVAAQRMKARAIGIEREPEYVKIAKVRLGQV
jgi:DNA modification methylase